MTRILYRLRHGMAANRLIAWSEDERAAADYRRWVVTHLRGDGRLWESL